MAIDLEHRDNLVLPSREPCRAWPREERRTVEFSLGSPSGGPRPGEAVWVGAVTQSAEGAALERARRMDRFAQMIVSAARRAEADSGVDIAAESQKRKLATERPVRVGVVAAGDGR